MTFLRKLFGRTVIPDQDNQARTSEFNGQRFVLGRGDSTTVDGAPVLTFTNDRVSFLNKGTASTTGDTSTVVIEGDKGLLVNSRRAEITAEDTGVTVSGEHARVLNFGKIEGDVNGVNFANGGNSSGNLTNFGTIQSDSRAINIGGDGVRINNFGDILGTGNQRNGTIYSDGSADNYKIINQRSGTIDAGSGNDGAGIALQTGDETGDVVNGTIINRGDIAGRGQAAATGGTAGDGIRLFAGADDATFRGNIINSGDITSESTQGPVSAVRISDGLSFDGTIQNSRSGLIDGANNGVYFGDAAHDAKILNYGTIQSDSRAVNIDGTGVHLINSGDIRGTGNQRNGTVYADGTADEYSITNLRHGLIDAGKGNDGAGIALQTGDETDDVVTANIYNSGEIAGRGQAAPTGGTAGDGIRIFAGADGVTFQGDIVNHGDITSESTQGPVGAIRIANGASFDGTIYNGHRGLIDGANNGVYFGTGSHDATVRNFGTIQSANRAVNIDGSGVDLINAGDILGTGNQRNGTVYADATAEDYSITNLRHGEIDAGTGNSGSGVALQTGDEAGDIVSASVTNAGDIRGRGDATEGNTVGDGVRIFSSVEGATFEGNITNSGLIAASNGSDAAVGISIEDGVTLDGRIVNTGRITANQTAIDATEAGGRVLVENTGHIVGDVRLSAGNDVFDGVGGRADGVIDGGAGNDDLVGGSNDDVLIGGLGNDTLIGGNGTDTAAYNDADVPVTVNLDAGTATRETGFSLSFGEVPVVPLTLNPALSGDFVTEALDGNLYFNVHTNDFNGGGIRGQLDTVVDNTVGGTGTIVISGGLDASQEPGPTSDSEATGSGSVAIEVVNGVAVSYSLDLDISGLATSDLLPVAGVSSIHLHNAPAGVNGPVTLDAVQDAGGDVNGVAQLPASDTGDGNVFAEVLETDTLSGIENAIGSNDADVLIGNAGANRLEGLSGDDDLTGGLNADVFVFGPVDAPSNDTVSDFSNGEDLFDVSAFGFTDFGDIGVAQQGNDTLVTFAAQNTVTLANVDAGDIDAGDFLFTV